MNFTGLKNNIESLKYYLNDTEVPKEIKDKEIERIFEKMLNTIEESEQEYKDIKDFAWKLANKF